MDKVWLKGIKCRCRIGVPEGERLRPQEILIDVGLEFSTAAAGTRDDFHLTVDYWAIEKAVRKTAEIGERRLVEALAEQIAALALAFDKRIRAVSVAVHKKPAAMPRTREVIVEIERRR